VQTSHVCDSPYLPTSDDWVLHKSGTTSRCHCPPVLETVHLALLPVQPTGYVEAEAPLSPGSVSWRFKLCQLGLGYSSSTSTPDQKVLRPEGFKPSLLHPWPAATTTEDDALTQTTASSPRSKAPAPCSRFWRGADMYALDLLGYTNFGSVRSPWSWRLWIYISTLRFSDHRCRHYSKGLTT
jgi:hypothetical protein